MQQKELGKKDLRGVGAWPPVIQELQLSSGPHFWSLPELSFRDACAQPVYLADISADLMT